jgi:hypothetical protein
MAELVAFPELPEFAVEAPPPLEPALALGGSELPESSEPVLSV